MSAPTSYPSSQAPHPNFQPAKIEYLEGGSVGFYEAIKLAFRNAFVYRGRASRSAYWWFGLFEGILFFALGVIASSGTSTGNGPSAVAGAATALITVLSIGLGLVNLALTVRRLHDSGRSGWWWLIVFAPFVGLLALLIFTTRKGTPGLNQYRS